ncbi:unnamed protein product [Fraxinus pennsylvanica]|uniref:Uncharacterized protein n=1 Tax=Fraxinus pennsylvanica TaxID=56036 RepID=A0AAD2E8J2_9LAMI|nr:unnamed protein product [Fraxinus pennsylvanica]
MRPLAIEEDDDNFANAGTVDYSNKPANKKKTVNWKTCHFILGNDTIDIISNSPLPEANLMQERLGLSHVSHPTVQINLMTLMGLKRSSKVLSSVVSIFQSISGALIASSVLVWIQVNIGWGWGFGIPAVAMAIVEAFYFQYQKPSDSLLTRLRKVVVAALRKIRVVVPYDKTSNAESIMVGSRKLDSTDELRHGNTRWIADNMNDGTSLLFATSRLEFSKLGSFVAAAKRYT